MGDSGLGAHLQVVEYRHAGGLAAGAGGGGHGHQWLERSRDRLANADRMIDVGEQVRRVGGVQVGRLRGVHAGAPAHRREPVAAALPGGADRLLKRSVAGLYPGLGIADRVDAGATQRLARHRHRFRLRHYRIGHQERAPHAEGAHLETQLAGGAGTELDARPFHVEDRLSGHNLAAHDAPFRRRVGSSRVRLVLGFAVQKGHPRKSPAQGGAGYRISGWPARQPSLVTVICLGCALADLGTVTVSSPSRKRALICSASTSCGSAKERLKAPLRRSRIT